MANIGDRAVAFLRAPAADGEVALLALVGVAMVLAFGLLWGLELRGTLAIAGGLGLAIRGLLGPNQWRVSWRALLVLLVAIGTAALVGISAGIILAASTHDWKVAPDPLAPAPGARPEILVSPCPSVGEQLSRRPDGSYVCSVPMPPDPGTGPVLAPTTKR